MTYRERVKAAIAFQKTDLMPVGPYMANHCSVAMGYRLKDCYTNAENLANARYKAWEFYRQDIITVQADGYYAMSMRHVTIDKRATIATK